MEIEITIETSRRLALKEWAPVPTDQQEPREAPASVEMEEREIFETAPELSPESLLPQPLRQPVRRLYRIEVGDGRRIEGHIEGTKRGRLRWERSELNERSFAALLALFDADRERAGEKYAALRLKLAKFFECRGCDAPDDLADETINRAARRLDHGEVIRAAEPIQYFYGVARNVLHEYWASAERQFLPLEDIAPAEHPRIDPQDMTRRRREIEERERLLELLDDCLRELTVETRKLLLEYYRDEKRARIEHRREMAERMGITVNALKIRVCRIRSKLERCVIERLSRISDRRGGQLR